MEQSNGNTNEASGNGTEPDANAPSSTTSATVATSVTESTITATSSISQEVVPPTEQAEQAASTDMVVLNPYLPPAERLVRFEVPIRKEYLKEIFGPPAPVAGRSNQGQSTNDSGNNRKRKQSGNDPKQRKRPRVDNVVEYTHKLCRSLTADQVECRDGDKCKYSHDAAGYLQSKPKDLGDVCYSFQVRGRCPAGIECRYGNSHIVDNKSIVNAAVEAQYRSIANSLSRDLQISLRKKTFPLPRSEEPLKRYGEGKKGPKKSQYQNKNQTKATGTTVTTSTAATPEASTATTTVTTTSTIPVDTTDIEGPLTATLSTKDSPKRVDFVDKLILAPLTTIGNLPYRRICKRFGADITISEMALAPQILQGHKPEWALLQRHPCEDVFGVQLAGAHVDALCPTAELLRETVAHDFIDINCGCPIDLVCNKGYCSALLDRPNKIEAICRSMKAVMDVPLTIKMRIGTDDKRPNAHKIIPNLGDWGVSAFTIHGRSKKQRYSRRADWGYVKQCVDVAKIPAIGNGDVYNWEDAMALKAESGVSSLMIARGAIVKPWIFTEIKEKRHWDISATERFGLLQDFVHFGLEHWGSDSRGVETLRSFLLNWLSFLYRYVPVGITEVYSAQLNLRPPAYFGRSDLETLLASDSSSDWIKISEMLLGPVPDGFSFIPKHNANAYATPASISTPAYTPTSVLADVSS